MIELLIWVCLLLGALLSVIGGIGLLRFPDFYSRLHAVSITDTLCTGLIFLALGMHLGWSFASVKLFLIYAFLFFTSPTASYSLGNGAFQSGLKPWTRESDDH